MATRQARFEAVAMPHLEVVYRMARRLTGNEADAEDLVQETYLKAYGAFENFELRRFGAKPWLLKILHNSFYTRIGKRVRQAAVIDDYDLSNLAARSSGPDAGAVGIAGLNWEDFDEELKAAVQKLAPEYREVLLLWALEELSYKEIAEVCGCALGTVMSRLYRARQQVSRLLEEYARDQGLSRGVG